LTGGPGQAATESFVQIRGAFRRVERERDIVLVDQRGTGSSNPLRCPKPEDTAGFWLLEDDVIEPWVVRCLEALDASPEFYTTAIAMEDLDAVREALGYERVNLYGVSYGTRAALSYLRQFPERVRSVILDGVAPPSKNLGMDVARDAQRALDLLVDRCADDAACHEEFPELARDLDSLMAALPAPVTLRHPRTGDEETIELQRSMAAFAIRLATYSQETASIVPLLLRSAANGDLRPLAAQFLMTTSNLDDSMADAMGYSVICSEDFPFFDASALAALNEGTYLGAVQTDSLSALCPLWPREPIPADFKEPVAIHVPVLLLSGEADPVTPPSNGELVAASLPTSLHLIAPGQGHMVIHRGCIARLAAEFIGAGSLDVLDFSCVDDIEPQAFFTSFAGPTP
jgi:pimeloyl-ACP methyl ester carboxylesterase